MSNYERVSTRATRIQELDDELNELEKPVVVEKPDEDKIVIDPNLSDAEQTWQKRYGDARRQWNKEVTDLKKVLQDKDTALESATKQQIKFPKNATMAEVM